MRNAKEAQKGPTSQLKSNAVSTTSSSTFLTPRILTDLSSRPHRLSSAISASRPSRVLPNSQCKLASWPVPQPIANSA
jgi:hypothetical protein